MLVTKLDNAKETHFYGCKVLLDCCSGGQLQEGRRFCVFCSQLYPQRLHTVGAQYLRVEWLLKLPERHDGRQ